MSMTLSAWWKTNSLFFISPSSLTSSLYNILVSNDTINSLPTIKWNNDLHSEYTVPSLILAPLLVEVTVLT